MKQFFSFLGMAILGGAISLGGYKILFNDSIVAEAPKSTSLETINTNFSPVTKARTNEFSAMSIDFTIAAEKTVNSVVHVKNTTIRTQNNPLDIFFGNGNGKSCLLYTSDAADE